MRRREFIKRGALFMPTIFIPRLIRAQSILTADGLAAYIPPATSGGGGGGAAWTLIAETSAAGDGNVGHTTTTTAIDTTGANLIVVLTPGGSFRSVSDSKGNTWTQRNDTGGTPRHCISDKISPTVGSGHTFSINAGSSIIVLAFAKSGGAPVFDTQTAGVFSGNWVNGTTLKPGSITPATSADLMISGLCYDVTSSPNVSVDSSYTAHKETAAGPGACALAYKIKSDSSAEDVAWLNSLGTNPDATASHAAYK